MTRYYDVAVGKMFKFMGALFVVLPFDWEEDTYLNICVYSESPCYEVGYKYEFLNETSVVEVEVEKLHSLLDD